MLALSPTEEQELNHLLELDAELELKNFIDKFYPDKGTDGTLFGFKPNDTWNESDGTNPSWPRGANHELLEPKNPSQETWSRHLYPQQLEFFRSGKHYSYRLLMAANQVGKSTCAGYEVACAAMGDYPDWWEGERYERPVKILIAGVDTKSMRQVIQEKLLGPVGAFGTGLIRYDALDFDSLKDAQKADTLITSFRVKHKSGGHSTIELKSYEAGVRAFMGFTCDLIWLDEEPPSDVFEECKTRLITTGGKMMLTFTPLLGMTETIESFIGSNEIITGPVLGTDGKPTSKMVVRSEWLDVPHITYTAMREQLEGMPIVLRDAKSKGIPSLGSGAVYPIREESVFIDPFPIPKDWKRVYALDFGWEDPTAVLWMAINPDDNKKYIYSEHYMSHQPTAIHVQAVKQRSDVAGFEIPGVCDPSGGGRSANDGKLTKDVWGNEFGVHLENANNAIAPGIQKVLNELVAGTLKIFNTCGFTKGEFKKYRYEKGKLRGADHAMDCLRYLCASGVDAAEAPSYIAKTYLPTHKPRF